MKIAIVKLSALGDIVHAMVALQFIKKYRPEIVIDWVVEENFRGVLENNPHINQIHTVNLKKAKKQKSLRLIFRELIKVRQFGKYDIVIDAQGLIKSALVARFIRSRKTSGFDKHSIRESFASSLYNHTTAIDYDENTINRNIAVICNPLDITTSPSDIMDKEPFLFTGNDKTLSNRPYILFVIGSTWESRNYPKEKFVEIAEQLRKDCFVVWGSESELKKAKWMANQSSYIYLLPKLNINELKFAILQSSLLIGNDTGPTHMAWGLNTPSITLFGPTPISRVYQTSINKVLKSNSVVNPFKLNKNDFSIQGIKVKDIVEMSRHLLDLNRKQ